MNAGIIPEYALISIPIQSVPTSMEVTVVIVIEVIWRITIQACLRESSLTVQVRIIFPSKISLFILCLAANIVNNIQLMSK